MEHSLDLDLFNALDELIVCSISYETVHDADPYHVGHQVVWRYYYTIENIKLSFSRHGTTYSPTGEELEDWERDIDYAIEKHAEDRRAA
jgi:hypothetical protein